MTETSSSRPVPTVVADVAALPSSADAGVLWRLAEPGRQLDANLVRLRPEQSVDTHVEAELDVLLLVVDGDGTLDSDHGAVELRTGTVLWLPRGSARALRAGAAGLTYLTTHLRRPGLQIRSR